MKVAIVIEQSMEIELNLYVIGKQKLHILESNICLIAVQKDTSTVGWLTCC